jgi:hypothetical protein
MNRTEKFILTEVNKINYKQFQNLAPRENVILSEAKNLVFTRS